MAWEELKKQDILRFNQQAETWHQEITERVHGIAAQVVKRLAPAAGKRVLDVGCGTGVLYHYLRHIPGVEYLGMDIAEQMVAAFHREYPEAQVIQGDFEKLPPLEGNFDYVVIYNSIPHFYDLGAVFANAHQLLSSGGKFVIAHGRTRGELAALRQQQGIQGPNEGIPSDQVLKELCQQQGFHSIEIEDETYFYFSCVK